MPGCQGEQQGMQLWGCQRLLEGGGQDGVAGQQVGEG